jgi:hypothetical protein
MKGDRTWDPPTALKSSSPPLASHQGALAASHAVQKQKNTQEPTGTELKLVHQILERQPAITKVATTATTRHHCAQWRTNIIEVAPESAPRKFAPSVRGETAAGFMWAQIFVRHATRLFQSGRTQNQCTPSRGALILCSHPTLDPQVGCVQKCGQVEERGRPEHDGDSGRIPTSPGPVPNRSPIRPSSTSVAASWCATFPPTKSCKLFQTSECDTIDAQSH